MIGEDHGLAEVPLLTKALVDKISYDLFVTEIDSVTAAISKEVASNLDLDQIMAFHHSNPSALSFYSSEEEFELLKSLSQSGADIWGLDQVSLFSTGIVLRRLSDLCESTETKSLVDELAALSDALYEEAVRSGNYDTLFIYSSKGEVFEQLKDAVSEESEEAKNIVKELEFSWKIYNGIDGYNYSTRLGGMKSKLLNYYFEDRSNEKKRKKVLYKFGAYHGGKAESAFGGYDVGNLISNLAHAEGESSYHLMVIGKKGSANTFIPTEGMQTTTFSIADSKSPLHSLEVFSSSVEDSQWSFFDLRSIRKELKKEKIKVQGSFLKATIYGYDGLVMVPKANPSILIR